MTDEELRLLAAYIVKEQANSKEWMEAYVRAKNGMKQESKYISLKEAAVAIGRSASWLYKHKGEFSYEKSADSKSSIVMFDSTTLQEEFANYLRKGSKFVPMEIRKVM